MFTTSIRLLTSHTKAIPLPRLTKPTIRHTSTLLARVNAITMSQSATPKITSLVDLPSSDAKWIKLQKATYTDAKGKERIWELASRKTTPKSGVDAVAMGNIIYHPTKPPSTILVIQFRPPVNAFTIEWPAGLIDANETPEEAAVRELYEETGYQGKVISSSPAVSADPGMSSATLVLCMVEIHLGENDPEPEQHLEESEDIQRVNVPLSELYERLEEFAKEGYVVAAKLYHWAAGVQFHKENPGLFEKGGKKDAVL
jgi:ADP-ribose pyrophosphatase